MLGEIDLKRATPKVAVEGEFPQLACGLKMDDNVIAAIKDVAMITIKAHPNQSALMAHLSQEFIKADSKRRHQKSADSITFLQKIMMYLMETENLSKFLEYKVDPNGDRKLNQCFNLSIREPKSRNLDTISVCV